MKRASNRRTLVVAMALLAVLLIAASVIAGWFEIAIVGVAALLAGTAVLVYDVRAKTSDVAHLLRWSAKRQQGLLGALEDVRTAIDSSASTVERRVLDALTAEGQRAAQDRAAISAAAQKNGDRAAVRLFKDLRSVARGETRETEALLQLIPRSPAEVLLPPSGKWALNARSLAHLVDIVTRERPSTILELGSGTSTVWLAHLLAGSGARIVSIDHSHEFAQLTSAELQRHGLAGAVDLRVAPLVEIDGDRRWYDRQVFADVSPIDLVLIDGPPEATGPMARFPAFDALRDQLGDTALILLDDSDRADETAAIEQWLASDPTLSREDHEVSRLAVLRRRPSA